MALTQIASRTKSGIFPLVNKGAVAAALWQESEDGKGANPLAVLLIGRQPSKSVGSYHDTFEVGFYDIAGLWRMLQTDGFLLGTSASSPRFYGIGEQKKLPDAEKWEVKKEESCIAHGARISTPDGGNLHYLLCNTQGAEHVRRNEWVLWRSSEEKLGQALQDLKIPASAVVGREFCPSRYQRWLCISPELKNGGYVYANTEEQAARQFRSALKKQKICCPEEWQKQIWEAFQKQGWLTALQGIKMAGFRLMNDPFEARMLIGRMIRNSFHPTDKGFDPDLPILPPLPGM